MFAWLFGRRRSQVPSPQGPAPGTPFAAAVQAFEQREYLRCTELCGKLMESNPRSRVVGLPWQLFFISSQRAGIGEVAGALAAKFLHQREAMAGHVGEGMREWLLFENELVRVTPGHKSVAEVLPGASTEAQRCQVHFYAGARLLTLGKRTEAHREFDACLAVPCDCVERQLAQAEIDSLAAGDPGMEERGVPPVR
jgi:hypothetical protein